MLESEIKKLRETLEQTNEYMVQLLGLQHKLLEHAVPVNVTHQPRVEAHSEPPAPMTAQPPAAAAAPSLPAMPQAATPTLPPMPTPQQTPAPSMPPMPTAQQVAAPQPAQAPAMPAGPSGAMTEHQAYATQLAAQYSARTGNPAEVMGVAQRHGILNIAATADAQLVPFITELKSLLGVQ